MHHLSKVIFIGIASAALLASCASDPLAGSFDRRVHEVGAHDFAMHLSPKELKKFRFIKIAAPQSATARKMMLASIAAGSQTNGVRSIYNMLMRSGLHFGVAGSSHAMNAASLKEALQRYQKGSSSNVHVYFVGLRKYKDELVQLAKAKGVALTYYLKTPPRIKIS